jgi:lysozyme family protein
MASFDHSISLIFKIEGGYSNHPKDNGGPTNYGITQSALNVYNKFHTQKDPATLLVKDLSAFEAREIYKILCWDPLRLDEIENQKLAHILFDQSVNQGGQVAVKRMQLCYNFVSRGTEPLSNDGIIGPKTLWAFNQTAHQNKLAMEFLKASQIFYCNIIKVQPNQIAFLNGWMNRTHFLMDYLFFSRA